MRWPCLHPGGCENDGLDMSLRCLDHLRADDVLALAQKYAVASVMYYDHDVSPISDAQYDGTCDWLLRNAAWREVPWLEQGMLSAGSGYDTSKVPVELQDLAEGLLPLARQLGQERAA